MRKTSLLLLALLVVFSTAIGAQEKQEQPSKLNPGTFAGLKLRNIGPALLSGRIADVKIDPVDTNTWYVGVASGNVWKTTNAGITWTPIFDHYGSYSIGCITIDPNNHHVIWIGTGEDKNQRSVGFGDGVYKSLDGGKTFANMGLKESKHISRIVVDPRDSDVVYVAALGPLWAPGGERGVYKTTDGGKTWEAALEIDEHTGVADLIYDPRDPDTLYAASHQRRRHVFTLVNGGPGSNIWKTTDAGASWRKIDRGLPPGDKGKITLTISPINPDVVYADVEARGNHGGFFRSSDRGESWVKMSDYVSAYPMYFQEIFADPTQFDRIYSADFYVMVSEDGGKTWNPVGGEDMKHVDNHAIDFFPGEPGHFLVGCDGGLYETFEGGKRWRYFYNLPVTQFYRVEVDNSEPFYHVYGGTQDNNSQGGPSRTINADGILNQDWFITVGGDGFQSRVDPDNPNIVYAQWQYGGLVRYDRTNGETIDIKPQPEKGEDSLRFHWDSPLIISPHKGTRLYFAAQRIFRSEDRGDTWESISPDLTAQIDRNKLEVMGRVWSVDAIEKNLHTCVYGNIVSLIESPLVEGLLYAGTDDGLIQVTKDGGQNWRKIESFPGIPANTYVSDLHASPVDPDTVFAVFNNHKRGDYKPYILKSTDRGNTWTSIAGDLKEPHILWTVIQDSVRAELLFAGSDFGLFFSIDGGGHWVQLKGGLPTIPIRDLEIQKRENDLACASFGRGFYILDDITPLRLVTAEMLDHEASLFPVKKALMFIQTSGVIGSPGQDVWYGDNPPFGAIFTYYLKDPIMSRKQAREAKEAKIQREGGDNFYPTWEELKAEDREEMPMLVFTVNDEDGNVVRRLTKPAIPGINRIAWDLHYPATTPPTFRNAYYEPTGPMVAPGTYTVTLSKYVDGELTQLGEPQTFVAEPLGLGTLPAKDKAEVLAFSQKTAELLRAVMGASGAAREAANRIKMLKVALVNTPEADLALSERARELELRLMDLTEAISGDPTKPTRNEPGPVGIMNRVQTIVMGHWASTAAPTNTHRKLYNIASEEFAALLPQLRTLIEVDLRALEAEAEAAGAPWTPGRALPDWEPK